MADISLVMGHYLPERLIDEGRRLADGLRASTHLRLAAWTLDEDGNRWELVLVFPDYGIEGPMRYFQRIREVQSKLEPPSSLPLEGMSLHDAEERWVRAVLSYFDPAHDPDTLIENQMLDSFFVTALYLYGADSEPE